MQIWNYHSATGELLGTGAADPNPVELGEWLVPAHATPLEPPTAQVGMAIVFAGGSWGHVPDHRGETWWLADAEFNTEPRTVVALGDPAGFEPPLTSFSPPAPPPLPALPTLVTALQIRLALNDLGLRTAIEQYVATAPQEIKDNWQYGTEFARNNVMIEAAAVALGKSTAEVDGLFQLAKSL